MSSTPNSAPGYNGLTELTEGLPADAYFDPRQYERELQRIWYRNWVYVGRSSELAAKRAFRTFQIRRSKDPAGAGRCGRLQGFHNTCRHRGAELCRESAGYAAHRRHRLPVSRLGVQPAGRAAAHLLQGPCRGFRSRRLSALQESGCSSGAASSSSPGRAIRRRSSGIFDLPLNRLDAWPLEDLVVGHVLSKTIESNWKIFWENYNECLHCPGVHPKLSSLVPIFGRGLLEERDDPRLEPACRGSRSEVQGRSARRRGDLVDATAKRSARRFPGCRRRTARRATSIMTGLPSMFIVGHVDYVRVVRLRPLGPEQYASCASSICSPAKPWSDPDFDCDNVVDFTNLVMTEDAEVCELNQRGLHARAARSRRGDARGVRDPAVPRVGCLNWRVPKLRLRAGGRAPRAAPVAIRACAGSAALAGAGAQHLQLGRLHRLSHHRRVRADDAHQGRLSDLRLERDAGSEPVGRAFRLRYRQHHHRILRPADPGGRVSAARQDRSCRISRTSILRCSRSRRRPIPAIATPFPTCMR